MDAIWMDEAAWNRLRSNRAERPGPCLGLYLNETGLSASRMLWEQKNGGRTPRIQPLSFGGQAVYGMTRQGADDFFVPPSWMGYRCTSEQTRREAFQSWFSTALTVLFQTEANALNTQRPMVVAVRYPEQRAWHGQEKAFQALLQESVPKELPLLIGLVPVSLAVSLRGQGTCLTVHTDKRWTEFVLRDADGKRIQHTSAALEMPQNGRLDNTPVVLRVNDNGNDGAAVWREARFPSWMEAFASVCQELRQAGWPSAGCAQLAGVCSDVSALQETLRKSGLLNGSAELAEHPADALAAFAGQIVAEAFIPRKQPNSTLPRPEPETERQKKKRPGGKSPKMDVRVKPQKTKPAAPPEPPKAKPAASIPERSFRPKDVFRCLDDTGEIPAKPSGKKDGDPFQL